MEMAKQMTANPIRSYTVRVPGYTAWAEGIKSLRRALAEARHADRVCRPGHCVYATHTDGSTTGPYRTE